MVHVKHDDVNTSQRQPLKTLIIFHSFLRFYAKARVSFNPLQYFLAGLFPTTGENTVNQFLDIIHLV